MASDKKKAGPRTPPYNHLYSVTWAAYQEVITSYSDASTALKVSLGRMDFVARFSSGR